MEKFVAVYKQSPGDRIAFNDWNATGKLAGCQYRSEEWIIYDSLTAMTDGKARVIEFNVRITTLNTVEFRLDIMPTGGKRTSTEWASYMPLAEVISVEENEKGTRIATIAFDVGEGFAERKARRFAKEAEKAAKEAAMTKEERETRERHLNSLDSGGWGTWAHHND